jgi:hypothetical protein
MNVANASAFPIFFSEKTGLNKKRNQTSKELGVKVKVVRHKFERHVKKILTCIQIFLATIRTELSLHFGAAIEAVGFCPVLFMTHEWG